MPTQRTNWGNLFNLFALLVLLAPAKSFSAQITWLGNNSTILTNAANWVGGVAPAGNGTDSILFGTAGTQGVFINNVVSGFQPGGTSAADPAILFNSSASSYTFNGSEILIANFGVRNQAAGTIQTFNTPIRINTSNNFIVLDGNNSGITFNDPTYNLNSSGARTITANFTSSTGGVIVLNGNISNSNATPGTGSLQVTANALSNASGTVILGGNNSSLNGTITFGSTTSNTTALGVTLTNTGAIRNLASIATSNVNSIAKLR